MILTDKKFSLTSTMYLSKCYTVINNECLATNKWEKYIFQNLCNLFDRFLLGIV